MKVSAVEGEVGRRAEVMAEGVEVGHGSRDDDGERDRASDARKGGAFESVGSESVGEGIHTGEVISQKQS